MRFRVKLLIAGLLLLNLSAKAFPNSGSWELLSPKKNEVLKSGELLITVRLTDSVKVFKGSFELFLDDYLITNFVKFSSDQISVLYTVPLSEGQHKIELHIKAKDVGFMTPIVSTFYINKFSGSKKDSVFVKRAELLEFKGTVSGLYKKINTTGPGEANSQSVPFVRDISVDVEARIGKLSFPLKYFNTSDDLFYHSGYQPPRSYLEYGIRYNTLEILAGDHNPGFDRLVMSGIRVSGYKLSLTNPRFQMQIIDGTSQLPFEGHLYKYSATDGAPPAGLRSDSTYIDPGLFKRHLTAGRFTFGNRLEGANISINVLRARDYLGSISYGASPSDNIVVGMDESFTTPGGNTKVNAGLATSIYTIDRSKGPATENQIDSFYGYKVGFNPNDFKDIFTLNFTTVKPGESSSAGYFNSAFRSANKSKTTDNVFTLDYRFFGPEFTSFGNPYVSNDLWAVTGQDELGILGRKIMIGGRYTFQENNLAANQISTMITQIISGNVLLAPSPKLPQLNIIVNRQSRKTPFSSLGNMVSVDDYSLNITGVLNYNLKIENSITGFNGSFTKATREDAVNKQSSNEIQVINAGITETFIKMNLTLDIHYATMSFSNPDISNTPLTSTYSGHVRYQVKKIKTTFGIGANMNQSLATILTNGQSSTRNFYNATISSQIVPGLICDLEAGMAPFVDLTNSSNNFSQNYGLVRLTYNFDFK